MCTEEACLCVGGLKCVERARGKYLLGTMWPAEQADVPVGPIHHIQKSAHTAFTAANRCLPNTFQQRDGPLQNPNQLHPM